MSTPKQYFQSAKNLFQSVHRLGRSIVRGVMNWLLRVLVRLGGHPSRLTQGGFVLPTVVMVMLVVILLTTAIVFRSFDRAKNASNFRVNQAVLNAATPALDRATAKIEQMFTDPLLPRGTPADDAIESVFDQAKYTFTDETQLTVTDGGTNQLGTAWRFPVDTDGNGLFDSFTLYGIYYRSPATEDGKPQQTRSSLEARTPPMDDSATRPACDALGTSATLVGTNGWYRVGSKLKKSFFAYVATVPITDINELNLPPGQFENYRGNQGFSALEYQRDIEKIPQKNNAILYEGDVQMAAGSGFRVNGRIFTNGNLLIKELPRSKTELFQVSSRNSCFYEVENSKIVVGGNYGYGTIVDTKNPTNSPIDIHLFQGTKDGNDPEIGETLTTKNTSVTPAAADIAYNSEAYERRIDQLVEKTIDDVNTSFSVSGTPGNQNNPAKVSSADPEEVKERTENLINNPANPLEDEKDQEQARRDALEIYFRNRTRRVAYAEVPYGTTENIASVSPVKDAGDNSLRPPNDWMFPYDPSDGKKAGGFSELPLNQSGDGLLPEATAFEIQEEAERENFVGDRLLIGNNLPALWYDEESQEFVSEEPQEIEGTKWDQGEGTRARKSRVNALDNLDTIARDGFWENAAAEIPEKLLDGVGGLRIVTGAGVYLPYDDDISTTASPVVWPDTMPMILPPYVDAATVGAPSWLPGGTWPTDLNGDDRPYLKMRATAVYHYTNHKQGEKPKPIACVATYYDPTNRNTARNPQRLFRTNTTPTAHLVLVNNTLYDLSNEFVGTPRDKTTRPDSNSATGDYTDTGNSFNGITFKPPSEDATGTMLTHLRYQAGLVYPNGRPVNQLLADALDKANEDDRTLAEQAAIDATICGLQIYGKVSDQGTWGDIGTPTPTPTSGYKIPHGTIKETAFLDARQVKLIDKLNDGNPNDNFDNFDFETEPLFNLLTSRYDLPIEQRYPLEVRATVIDLQELVNAGRTPSLFGTSNDEREYMFPNSGIIYATRDDALPDASNDSKPGADDGSANVSRTDFKLDPTRRPSGIMLINGSKLGRRDTFAEVEKGLTLASNLPVYVKGEFNPHKKAGTDTIIGEFEGQQPDNNTPANTFYSRDNLEEQFACRKGDERLTLCTQGDDWRAASIISDAVTLLSHNFREGVRVEGDYDLRNNQLDNIAKTLEATKGDTTDLLETESIQQKRLHNGFWNNDFAINGLSSGVWIPQGSIVKEDSEEDSEDSILPDFPNAATGDVELTDAVYSRTDPNADDKAVNSSYFNNMVTPVQRRGEFPEYVMEYCPHILVSDCGPGDWIINDNNGLKASNFDDFSGNDKKANTLRKVTNGVELDAVPGTAGTTATGAAPGLERYPRRVAFKRDGNNKLELRLPGEKLIPLGIDDKGNNDPSDDIIQEFPLPQLPARQSNALWFATNQNNIDELNFGYNHPLLVGLDVDNDGNLDQVVDEQGNPEPLTGSTGQPLLRPVLQLQYPTGVTAPFLRQDQLGNPGRDDRNFVKHARFTHWLPRATDLSTTETPGSVIFNAAFATGDTPSRPPHTNNVITPLEHLGDFNGGVLNLVRLLENWDWSPQGSGDPSITTQISGSLMQIKNSAYATGSYAHLPENKDTAEDGGPFNYPQMYSAQNTEGRVPFFEPSARNWGYDVGLLSQFPDLFAQQFTLPSTDEPNQFYREVSRNDPWVQRLLCGQNGNGDFAINETQRPDCS
ncbi:MAG: hormogonium polysaccharide biosynthesis protein HpsA [Coleofasciculus sp.]